MRQIYSRHSFKYFDCLVSIPFLNTTKPESCWSCQNFLRSYLFDASPIIIIRMDQTLMLNQNED